MTIEINDLVGVRISNSDGKRNVWFRIESINHEKQNFIGRLERCEWDFERYVLGERVQFPIKKIQAVFNEKDGLEWCYSDNVTRCDYKGLCRNK